MFRIRSIMPFFTAIAVFLTVLTGPKLVDTESVKLIDEDVFSIFDAFTMGQGIATDGEYFYTSGAITALNVNALGKYDFDTMAIVDRRFQAIPQELVDRGFDHIGGISCYNGKLYASVEGEPNDKYVAAICVYDAQTLDFTGDYYDLPYDYFSDGVPWCAVDGETGYLYASRWSHATSVYVYDVNNGMELVSEIPLQGELHRIQGGDFYDGTLYLSCDCKDEGSIKKVLALNVETGAVSLAFDRDVGTDNNEAEGLTVFPAEDGSLFHILDYNKLVSVYVRHYDVNM